MRKKAVRSVICICLALLTLMSVFAGCGEKKPTVSAENAALVTDYLDAKMNKDADALIDMFHPQHVEYWMYMARDDKDYAAEHMAGFERYVSDQYSACEILYVAYRSGGYEVYSDAEKESIIEKSGDLDTYFSEQPWELWAFDETMVKIYSHVTDYDDIMCIKARVEYDGSENFSECERYVYFFFLKHHGKWYMITDYISMY